MPRPPSPTSSPTASDAAATSQEGGIAAPRLQHRHIEVFRAVMLAGGVTGAAGLLFSSQPTVSRDLARMEQLLGYPLFERVQGRLRPNARALALWEEVQRSWQGLDRVIDRAVALSRPQAARISVLSMPALSHALLPAALARMRQAQGPVAVSVATQESPLLQQWMAAQRYDLGLTEQGEAPAGTRAVALPAVDEVAVLPAGHPLARKKKLQPADFADQAFISLAEGDPYRAEIDQVFADAGVGRQMLLDTHSAVAVCAMVQNGLGLAIVNPFTAQACMGQGLVQRPLAFSIPFRTQVLLPLHRAAVPEVDALVTALGQAAGSLHTYNAQHAGSR